MKTTLAVTTQGIRGGKNKHEERGYAHLTVKQSGKTLVNISVDAFEGQGKDYKERERPIIDIYFPTPDGVMRFIGTAEALQEKLFGITNQYDKNLKTV